MQNHLNASYSDEPMASTLASIHSQTHVQTYCSNPVASSVPILTQDVPTRTMPPGVRLSRWLSADANGFSDMCEYENLRITDYKTTEIVLAKVLVGTSTKLVTVDPFRTNALVRTSTGKTQLCFVDHESNAQYATRPTIEAVCLPKNGHKVFNEGSSVDKISWNKFKLLIEQKSDEPVGMLVGDKKGSNRTELIAIIKGNPNQPPQRDKKMSSSSTAERHREFTYPRVMLKKSRSHTQKSSRSSSFSSPTTQIFFFPRHSSLSPSPSYSDFSSSPSYSDFSSSPSYSDFSSSNYPSFSSPPSYSSFSTSNLMDFSLNSMDSSFPSTPSFPLSGQDDFLDDNEQIGMMEDAPFAYDSTSTTRPPKSDDFFETLSDIP